MTISALALYGSCARKDQEKSSDVDLFAITNESEYRMIIQNKINIACYPLELALKRAAEGDLFFLHIKQEAKAIYDPYGNFLILKDTFKYKKSYGLEIKNASDLGWFLADYSEMSLNYTLINKRIAWCVRTILIAQSAELGRPYFSALELHNFSKKHYVLDLIKNKYKNTYERKVVSTFLTFLKDFGYARPDVNKENIIDRYQILFKKTNNQIGIKTINAVGKYEYADIY